MNRNRPYRILLALLLLALAAAGVAVLSGQPIRRHGVAAAGSHAAEQPEVVSSIKVARIVWQSRIKAFGQVRAVQGADLSAELPGIVETIDFKSGADVPAGTVLMRLRANDDDARLAMLVATADLWAANVARDQKQFDAQAISRATLDLDNANLRSYRAQVAAQQALMQEKVVRAPFAGRLGIRMVDVGQYLTAGTPVVSLQALDPIYVDFNLPQQQVARVIAGQSVNVRVDSYPNRVFRASVVAVDSRIDAASRMAQVRASLPNPDHALLPGMFATVGLADGPPRPELTVPTTAISYNPYGDFVYVLSPERDRPGVMVATSRVITTGETEGDRVVVATGLREGETVVSAGQVKLRNGALVEIDNQVQPEDLLDPKPPEE